MTSARICTILAFVVQMSLVTQIIAASTDRVLGVWRPDPAVLAKIEKYSPNRASPELELNANGRFELINIPSSWSNVFGKPSGTISGASGKWRLTEGKASAELQMEILGVSMVATVSKEDKLDVIVIHIRDGDQLGPITFKRKWSDQNRP